MRFLNVIAIFLGISQCLEGLKSTFPYDLKCPVAQIPAGCVCKLLNKQFHLTEDSFQSLVSLSCSELAGMDDLKKLLKSVYFQFGPKYALHDLKIEKSDLLLVQWGYLNVIPLVVNLSLTNNNITAIQSRVSKSSVQEAPETSSSTDNYNLNPIFKISMLNISNNQISSLESDSFEFFKLVVLDLSKNSLYHLPEDIFSNQTTLESLSLASNKFQSLYPFLFKNLLKLKHLDLSDNQLDILSPQLFWSLPSLTFVSVSSNKLITLDNIMFLENMVLEAIEVEGNPWTCVNNSLKWIDSLNKNAKTSLSLKHTNCSSPSGFSNQSLTSALDILELIEDARKCPTCEICACSVIEFKNKMQVDCRNRSLSELPRYLPKKTKVVLLQHNHIKNLTHEFEVWKEVLFLRLDDNEIDNLNGFEESGLHKHLVVLSLAQNRFTDIRVHLLEQMINLLEIHLSDNPWRCDCNMVRFQGWLQEHTKQVLDIDSLYCATNKLQPLYKLLKSELCPQETKLFYVLDFINGTIIVLIVLILSKLTLDFWRQKKTGKLPRFWSFRLG